MIGISFFIDFYPLPDAAARLETLSPGRLGAVELTDYPLDPSEKVNFKNARAIKRLATVGTQHVFLLVADGTHDRHAIHDPEYCFRGAGWEIEEASRVVLPHGTGRFVRLRRKDGTTAEAVYWFTNGKNQFWSPQEYWWETSLRHLSCGRSGQEPVLVILSSADLPPANWDSLLKQCPALLSL